MNRLPFIFLLFTCLIGNPLAAQQAAPSATLDENTRLMQEYMARRAEWIELRRAALDKVKAAKDEKEKKQHRDKLAEEEKPILAKVNEAARAYRDAEKAKHDQLAAGKPAK
jgi:hypothetical protein